MTPFGVLIAGGVVIGARDLVPSIAREWARDPWSLARTIPLSVLVGAFGTFLAYALVRHGSGGLLDALGAQRTLEGIVEARRTVRGTKGATRYIRVAGEEITVAQAPFDRAHEGTRVRVRFGRFERELTELAVAQPKPSAESCFES